jgi:hypothetical protein
MVVGEDSAGWDQRDWNGAEYATIWDTYLCRASTSPTDFLVLQYLTCVC